MKLFKDGQKKFYLDFRFRDKRIRLKAFETERASQSLLQTIERLVDIYQSNGVILPELQRAIDCLPSRIVKKLASIGLLSNSRVSGKNLLKDHLDDFMAFLKSKRCSEKYLYRLKVRLARTFRDCKFTMLSDFDASVFINFVNNLDLSVKSKSHYISAVKEFAKYLEDTGLLPKNNFKLLKTPKVLRGDQVHARRALTAVEVSKLIRAAESGLPFKGISGTERSLIYRIIAETGLRFNEFKTLLVSDFDFAAGTLTVKDINSKNRYSKTVALRESTTAMVKRFLRHKTPQAYAFNLQRLPYGAAMLRQDLQAANIPYLNEDGYADFHSLRHTACSLLIQSGANVKSIQTIMGHRTVDMTLNKYTHLYSGQLKQAVDGLPDFDLISAKKVKTGTDDCIAENQAKNYCPKSAHESTKDLTKPDNSCNAITSRNIGFNALNSKETAFSEQKSQPLFLEEKCRRWESNPHPG